MGESVAVQQDGLAQTISLPGGGSSELDIVMKLHKVERHIRNSKLKVCALVSQAVDHAVQLQVGHTFKTLVGFDLSVACCVK